MIFSIDMLIFIHLSFLNIFFAQWKSVNLHHVPYIVIHLTLTSYKIVNKFYLILLSLNL